MSVFLHDELPVHEVPRIRTRILVGDGSGARETSVWEQWIDAGGFIPPHYHDVEEVLVILRGTVTLTQGDESTTVAAPATILIPAKEVHALRPAGQSQVHLLAMFPTAKPTIIAPGGKPRPLPWADFGRTGE